MNQPTNEGGEGTSNPYNGYEGSDDEILTPYTSDDEDMALEERKRRRQCW